MKNYFVYMHTFPNGKRYIGITIQTPEKRWERGSGYKGAVVYNAIQKYGWDNIKHEVLFSGLTQEQAEQKERELIAQYQSADRDHGYNIALGGNHRGKTSDTTKEKLRVASLKKNLSSETLEKRHNSLLGRKIGKESKEKMSIAALKRWEDPLYRENFIKKQTGKKQTEETIQKRVLKTKGKKRTPEQIERYKEAAKRRNLDPAYKAKHSAGLKRSVFKRSEALKKKWKDPEFRSKVTNTLKNKTPASASLKALKENWTKSRKKIANIDKNGSIIQTFNSLKECSVYFGISNKIISSVALGKKKQTRHGLKFKYIE